MSLETTGLPVSIYARYSTDRQDARSIEDQVRRCRVLADGSGFRVAAEYADAAVSGSHTERADLQRLIADARGGAFRSVLVDDLSRLSRDLGDTWRIVFEEMASIGVRVIDCSTNIASDAEGARLLFGVKALVNDEFLQNVRRQTWRGLEGRAIAGFHTGGKTFGYTTIAEPNPSDPEHPRRLPVVDEPEAALVRRVFEMYAAGSTFKNIAATLNVEAVPAPHDGGPRGKRGNKTCAGWGHTTIRAMLANERYVGRWTWNQRKWVRVPGKKTRRALMRPEAEHVVTELPALRIVSQDLWERVQTRIGSRKPGKGRAPGAGKLGSSLLTGLLRCGVCGGAVVIVSRRHKGGASYANFGCTVNRSRGDAICGNARTVSERKVTEAVIGALKTEFTVPDLVERFKAVFSEAFSARNSAASSSDEVRALERAVQDAEARVRNVTAALARIGFSDALADQLATEERRLAEARAALARARGQTRTRVLPHPRLIESYLRNLLAVIDKDKDAARTALKRHMPPLLLTPRGSGFKITGGFDLSICLEAAGSSAPRSPANGPTTAAGAPHSPLAGANEGAPFGASDAKSMMGLVAGA
jgi:DNA invertase Pin-like site-specific DNA recombinase